MSKNTLILVLYVILSSCDSMNENTTLIDNRIARVGDDILSESNLKQYQGSLLNRNIIINKWIETTLLAQAGENLEDLDINNLENKVENYRKSLLSYQYIKHKLKDMDSVVSELNILEYYNKNKNDLKVKEPIVLCRLLVSNKRIGKKFYKDLMSKDDDVIPTLQVHIGEHEGKTHLYRNAWITLKSLLKNTPFEKYIENHSQININRINFATLKGKHYYLVIFSIKKKGSIAPKEFIKEKIKNSILLSRRKNILKNAKEELLKKARKENKIDVYR